MARKVVGERRLPWRALLRDLGFFLRVPAALAVPALVVCAVAGEWRLAPGFLIAGLTSLSGTLALARIRPSRTSSSLPLSMVTVALTWLAIGLLATIPFAWWGGATAPADPAHAAFGDFWTAFFEAMSGITSTGLTMAADASTLPRAIQWWRTSLEWVGGVGVVVLAISFVRPAELSSDLFEAEGREGRISPTFQGTARRIWMVYGGLTVVSVLGFLGAGMPAWEALNHGMTGIATGGFTVTADSFAGYATPVHVTAIVIMLLGAVSFRVYGAVFVEGDWRAAYRDRATLVLFSLFALGSLAVSALSGHAASRSVFQWASALGTCGFQSDAIAAWNPAAVVALSLGMLIGGGAGSTTGGIKVDRAILIALGPIWSLRQRISRKKGVTYYVIDGKKTRESDALRLYRGAAALGSLFAGGILGGTLLLLVILGPSRAPYEVLFETTSAMCNVGLSTGITEAALPWNAKLVMIGLMWMGRLEVLAVLTLVVLPIMWLSREAA